MITLLDTMLPVREGAPMRRRYRIEDAAGYCEFTIWSGEGQNNRWLSSYGGSVWPYAWPEVFEYINPDTYYAGYVVRDPSVLPND